METLLSLTSKQAGDWFKDTLRRLGGLDQLVNTGLCSYPFVALADTQLSCKPFLMLGV